MYAEFDDSLITGNELIDSQHRELIDRINQLIESCSENPDRRAAVKMLNYLADYTEFHFRAEEELQEKVGYPGIKEHKEKHKELEQTVHELHEMLEEQEGPTEEFVRQVEKNVADWLLYHIKTFDRSVAEYVVMRENEQRL